MEKLPQGKKHLGAYFAGAIPLQTYQQLLLWLSGAANSDLSANKLRSTNGKTYSQA